jgi:hypothetical protein
VQAGGSKLNRMRNDKQFLYQIGMKFAPKGPIRHNNPKVPGAVNTANRKKYLRIFS